jgi:hypothetical protein
MQKLPGSMSVKAHDAPEYLSVKYLALAIGQG